jgi:Ca-activated chloride channel family protein
MSTTQTTATVQAPPTLTVKLDEKTVPMTVHSLRIDIHIAAAVSRTTLIVTFENPHDRDLEGELTFPLPDGAALCGYGLDIDGEMVDASLVEKQKARVVFEEEVRKGVDPGLLEQVRGNQFRTRIWPLPARGRRSVMVEYVSALDTRDGNSVYDLPLRFEPPQRDVSAEQRQQFAMWAAFFNPASASEPPSERFRLRVTVAKSETAPRVWDTEAFGFEDCGDAWVAETCQVESLPAKIRIALPGLTEDRVTVERFAEDEFYFRIDARVVSPTSSTPAMPTKVALVWDSSLSRATADKKRDFELLKALMARLESVDIDVFVLRNDVEEPRSFSIVGGESEAMLEMLSDMPYDGGTSLSALELVDSTYDAYLLFSDGISTLNDDTPLSAEIPVYVVSSDVAANRPLLRYTAEQSGGAYLDLTRVPVEQACQEIFAEGLSLLGVQYEKGAIADVFPSSRRLLESGTIGISGRLLKDEAEITLRFGRGNVETERRSFNVSRRAATSTGLIGRLWAQQKVDELSLFADRHGTDLLELGRRFHIVTPNTSLLVLETLDQHLEHKIAPAPSRRKMRMEYDRQMSPRLSEQARRQDAKLEQVSVWWQERVQWWEKKFDLSPPPVCKEPEVGPRRPRGQASDILSAALPAQYMTARASLSADFMMAEGMREMACSLAPPSAQACVAATEPEVTSASITVKPWDPTTPYLEKLKSVREDDIYDIYLEQRTAYGRSPSFYLDCATHLFKIGQRRLAIRVLTNVAELDLESPQLLRILAYKLETEGELVLASRILEHVLSMRPEEPQSYRDLALVLDRRGELRRAAELLWAVVTGEWDGRFPEIETIALMELNRVLDRARREGQAELPQELGIDQRLVKLLDQDLRVVLCWDADLTDVDLWVTEPNGERCYFSNNRTRMGGRISRDFTQGYGPEEYIVRRGMSGVYRIQANYYGSSQQTLTGPATVLATVFTNFGRPDEDRRVITVRVTEVKDVIDVGEVELQTS